MRTQVELLTSDVGILAVLMTGIVATGLAILADYAPERRRRREVSKTQRLR